MLHFQTFFFWILWLRETKQFREKTEHQYVSSKIEKAASLFQHLEITVFTIFMIWNFYTLFAFIAHKIVFRFKMYLFGELQYYMIHSLTYLSIHILILGKCFLSKQVFLRNGQTSVNSTMMQSSQTELNASAFHHQTTGIRTPFFRKIVPFPFYLLKGG